MNGGVLAEWPRRNRNKQFVLNAEQVMPVATPGLTSFFNRILKIHEIQTLYFRRGRHTGG